MPSRNGRMRKGKALGRQYMVDARRDVRQCAAAKVLAGEQNQEIARLEAIVEAGRESIGHEKALRIFAEAQATTAIEQLKEIHRARVKRVTEGGTP